MGDKPSLWVTYPKTSAVLRLTASVRINARSSTLLIVSVLTAQFPPANAHCPGRTMAGHRDAGLLGEKDAPPHPA